MRFPIPFPIIVYTIHTILCLFLYHLLSPFNLDTYTDTLLSSTHTIQNVHLLSWVNNDTRPSTAGDTLPRACFRYPSDQNNDIAHCHSLLRVHVASSFPHLSQTLFLDSSLYLRYTTFTGQR